MSILYNILNSENEEGYYIFLEDNTVKDEITTIKKILERILETNLERESKIKKNKLYVEIGPLLNFNSPWCSNVLSIFKRCGVKKVIRIEKTQISTNFRHLNKIDNVTLINVENTLKINISDKQYKKINLNQIDADFYGFDPIDIQMYKSIFSKYGRNPTDVELFDLSQSNSEHSRHWFFNGSLYLEEELLDVTLMDLIKKPLKQYKNNSLIAFSDNSSVIKGRNIYTLIPKDNIFIRDIIPYDISFTSETHNFPTGVAPFPGAATGTGGRIRDNLAVGRGGLIIASTVGYSVGELNLPNKFSWEDIPTDIPFLKSPCEIEIQASNGASDYGNKIGEPIISGFTRSFGMTLPDGERYEYLKPIMFTGGIGMINSYNLKKEEPKEGMLVIRLGGPAYRIGIGGGSASSKGHDKTVNINAIQRGDPEMANRLCRVIRTCVELGEKNPIASIHDQGAGGMANVTKEIISPAGALINIDKVDCGDNSMNILEKWVAEYQEQVTILLYLDDLPQIIQITKRENCPMSVVGFINDTGRIDVYSPSSKQKYSAVDLNLKDILENVPQKKFSLKKNNNNLLPLKIPNNILIDTALYNIFKLVSVGSKRFLTNKVDRSVTGLIAQQQCVGPTHMPLANVAVVAHSHYIITGTASAIGEQPIKGLISPKAMVRMSVGEMLTNLMWAKITNFSDIKCAGNWMWPGKDPKEAYNLYIAVKAFSKILNKLQIAVDGGKDSLSMFVKNKEGKIIKSPGTLVVSGYVQCSNINKTITPDLKRINTELFLIDLGLGKNRLGGSSFAHILKQIGNISPDVENITSLKNVFIIIQELIHKNMILSGHDRSDGGLLTTIIEMCLAGNKGCRLCLKNIDLFPFLFNEELGIVIETTTCLGKYFKKYFPLEHIYYLGKVVSNNKVTIYSDDNVIFDEPLEKIRKMYESTSTQFELKQTNPTCVKNESKNIGKYPEEFYNPKMLDKLNTNYNNKWKFNVAIIREEGSNGDREMASILDMVGFTVTDITMTDFEDNPNLLEKFRGIIFVGGFSFSDALGAATGWYASIIYNSNIKQQFDNFYNRSDTFSLGICNGCQLMARLGWINASFVENDSNRFESRFPIVKIMKTNCIFFTDMEECRIGIWVAHKEGKCIPKTENIPIRYVDDKNNITEKYPYNPNGSIDGAAAVCSDNGRHLAMMPHPERCFLKWQFPYCHPPNMNKIRNNYTPWFIFFKNAYKWCC